MQAPGLEGAAIDEIARLFSAKRGRGDVDTVLSSLGIEHIPSGDKTSKLRIVLLDLLQAGDIARLGSVIDALTNLHSLQPNEIERISGDKMLLGIGRIASVDLGDYGRLSVDSRSKQMLRAYATLRALENKLREFIDFKLRLSFGDKWWQTQTAKGVRDSADRARAKELASSWQSIQTDADIYYADFSHLKSIISRSDNWPFFEPSFVDQSVVFKLGELEVVRNIIAHNRSLSDIELRRLELYTHDVLKAIGAIKD